MSSFIVAEFSHTKNTTASKDQILALWKDVDHWPLWDSEIERSSLDEGLTFAPGAMGTLKAKGSPPGRIEILSLDQNGVAYEAKLPLAKLILTRTVSDEGELRSLTHHVLFKGLLGPLFALLLGRKYRAILPEVMTELVKRAEAQSSES